MGIQNLRRQIGGCIGGEIVNGDAIRVAAIRIQSEGEFGAVGENFGEN